MSSKQLAALFLSSLGPWIAGNGLVLLPTLYAVQLGADSAVAGYFLAFSYTAIALGALSAVWVSVKFWQRKQPLIIGRDDWHSGALVIAVGLATVNLALSLRASGSTWL